MFVLRMFLKTVETLICVFCVQTVAFVNFGNGQEAMDMIEEGKTQYQLLQERGRLPKYGDCWRGAIEHVHEGCRYLSEETQSDIALHITNCFLAMSGHDTYNCELDKKPNLRGICISSMSDRAFNVYTEFYTHTQNICWFLRGQVWQEKITKNTMEVDKKLENSLNQQELLLKQQQESLQVQEQLLQYGLSLEKILNESKLQAAEVLEEIRVSTLKHKQLLSVMSDSLSGLKSWLIGEISWFDSLIFYLSAGFIIIVLTSTTRTASARLPLLIILSLNIVLERFVCDKLSSGDLSETKVVNDDIYWYIWWCRRFTICTCAVVLFLLIYKYPDYAAINNSLLLKIQEQNKFITSLLDKRNDQRSVDSFSESNEKSWNGVDSSTTPVRSTPISPRYRSHISSYSLKESNYTSQVSGYTPDVSSFSSQIQGRYNLRSRLTPVKQEKPANLSLSNSTNV